MGTEIVMALFLGVVLAATCGLRAFLPLAMLSGLAFFDLIDMGRGFHWMGNPIAMVCFSSAVLVEIVGDKIPLIDHMLDTVGAAVRPAAGALAASSVIAGVDPIAACVIGLATGGVVAGGVHLGKASLRVGSTATTAGVANPVLSLIEDVVVLGVGGATALAVVLMSA